MSDLNKNQDSFSDEKIGEVTSSDTQYQIQCEDIRVINSTLNPLLGDDVDIVNSSFSFHIDVLVNNNKAFSNLDVQVKYLINSEQDDIKGYLLSFKLMATFLAGSDVKQTELGDFTKIFTLSILWPYAREYVSDQFRRAGLLFTTLPIINPQSITEQLIKDDLIKITYQSSQSD
jgi:preprotein translocase subunit SecB